MIEGVLVAESLREGSNLRDLQLVVRDLSRERIAGATDEQPSVWTVIAFTADTDPDTLAERLSRVLASPGWYADFYTNEATYVVYPDKIFRYPRGDPAGRLEAIAHGRASGVPEDQLDWSE